jgi:hypothetical protein
VCQRGRWAVTRCPNFDGDRNVAVTNDLGVEWIRHPVACQQPGVCHQGVWASNVLDWPIQGFAEEARSGPSGVTSLYGHAGAEGSPEGLRYGRPK